MRLKYDPSVDAALILFGEGPSAETLELRPDSGIFVDLDENGQLLMLEIFEASQKLPESVLAVAEFAIDESRQLLIPNTD